jgi:guanylate kinase
MNENLIVISGPSGSGKSTLIQMLLKMHPELPFSVSHTTRPRRKGETDGEDYFFVSKKDFTKMIDENSFLEWAEVHQHLYGSSWNEIEQKSKKEAPLILDLDIQGARNLKSRFPGAWYIFVVPPSFEELRKRLIKRHGKILSSENKRRLGTARDELAQFEMYDFIIVNDHKDRAFSALECIYRTFFQRMELNKNHILSMIGRKT